MSGRSLPPSILPPSRNPSLGRGRGPAPSPPSGYPLARARRGSTVIPAFEQESIPGTRERPRQSCPILPPLGTRVRGHDVVPPSILPPSRNPSLGRGRGPAPYPPSGYPRARARRGSTVIPAFEQESIPGTRERPRPISPLWVPACAGTTWFHRHSCLRAGIHPWDARGLAPSPPSG